MGAVRTWFFSVRPASGSDRDLRLSIDNVLAWLCRVLPLYSFEAETDTEIKHHQRAFVSLLWEYEYYATTLDQVLKSFKPAKYFYKKNTKYIKSILLIAEWLLDCRSCNNGTALCMSAADRKRDRGAECGRYAG
jgi:hypothetical protein